MSPLNEVPGRPGPRSGLVSNPSERVPVELSAALARIGVIRNWRRNQVLHWSGERLSAVLCVRQGRLRVRRIDSAGHEQILSWFDGGMLVAVAPVIVDQPFHFDIVADGPCKVLHASRTPFMQLLGRDASAASAIAVVLAERLSHLLESHVTQANDTLAERVWFRLNRLADQARRAPPGDAPFIAVTQQELADAVGGSRYRVGLELQRLAERGLIALARGRIRIVPVTSVGPNVEAGLNATPPRRA